MGATLRSSGARVFTDPAGAGRRWRQRHTKVLNRRAAGVAGLTRLGIGVARRNQAPSSQSVPHNGGGGGPLALAHTHLGGLAKCVEARDRPPFFFLVTASLAPNVIDQCLMWVSHWTGTG